MMTMFFIQGSFLAPGDMPEEDENSWDDAEEDIEADVEDELDDVADEGGEKSSNMTGVQERDHQASTLSIKIRLTKG